MCHTAISSMTLTTSCQQQRNNNEQQEQQQQKRRQGRQQLGIGIREMRAKARGRQGQAQTTRDVCRLGHR
jgi:hypothetical protein